MAEPGAVASSSQASAPTAPGTPPVLPAGIAMPARARRVVLGPPLERGGTPSAISQDTVPATSGAPLAITDRPLEPGAWRTRRRAAERPSAMEGATARSSAGAASGAGAQPSATVMPPIVARRPGRRVQRDPADAAGVPMPSRDLAADGPPAGAPTPAAEAPVRIDRSSSGAAAASDLRANAFTSGDTIVLPESHGPLDSGRGRSLLAHELVHVGQQRRLGTALPHEGSAAGQQLEQEARSAERLVETTVAARMPTYPAVAPPGSGLPLARIGARSTTPATSSAGSGSNAEVQRAVDGALTLASRGPGHAGGSESASLTAGAPIIASSVDDHITGTQRASVDPAPTGNQAHGGGQGQDDHELDELARQLYDRIRFRLSRELLLDRERSGLLNGSR